VVAPAQGARPARLRQERARPARLGKALSYTHQREARRGDRGRPRNPRPARRRIAKAIAMLPRRAADPPPPPRVSPKLAHLAQMACATRLRESGLALYLMRIGAEKKPPLLVGAGLAPRAVWDRSARQPLPAGLHPYRRRSFDSLLAHLALAPRDLGECGLLLLFRASPLRPAPRTTSAARAGCGVPNGRPAGSTALQCVAATDAPLRIGMSAPCVPAPARGLGTEMKKGVNPRLRRAERGRAGSAGAGWRLEFRDGPVTSPTAGGGAAVPPICSTFQARAPASRRNARPTATPLVAGASARSPTTAFGARAETASLALLGNVGTPTMVRHRADRGRDRHALLRRPSPAPRRCCATPPAGPCQQVHLQRARGATPRRRRATSEFFLKQRRAGRRGTS